MKNITLEQLETLANAKNIDVDVMRNLAEAQGYTVIEPVALNIADALAELEDNDADDEVVITANMAMSDFANGLNDQELYDLMIVQTKANLYKIAKNTDSGFAPTAFYEKDQWDRMYADAESKWHKVILASEKLLKSVKRDKNDSDNKARLVGAMIAFNDGRATVQDNAKAEAQAVERKTTRKTTRKAKEKATQKVNGKTGETYVEAPSQARANERKNRVKNDADAQNVERYEQLRGFMDVTDFANYPFVETCLRGHLNNYALKTGVEESPYKVAWDNAVAANKFRKQARKFARKGNVRKMAQLIVDNRAEFKGLAFVHKSGIEVVSKRYRVYGEINPLYAEMGDYVPFLQEATKLANDLQRA